MNTPLNAANPRKLRQADEAPANIGWFMTAAESEPALGISGLRPADFMEPQMRELSGGQVAR